VRHDGHDGRVEIAFFLAGILCGAVFVWLLLAPGMAG
jgi:hypothetical protein